MRKPFIFILALICHTAYSQNITVSGTIKDSVQSIPYASVYLKNSPTTGTMAGSDGTFSLNIPSRLLPDTLMISFVGYITHTAPLQDTDMNMDITLHEDIINLSEINVTSTERVKNRVEMDELLRMIREQFLRDMEDVEALYHIRTKTSIASSEQILAYQEAVVDTYEEHWKKKDMTRRISTRAYVSPDVSEIFIENDSLVHEGEEEEKIDLSSNIKGLTVSSGMIEDFLNEPSRKWKYNGQDDKHYILTFKDKVGFLGIVKFRQTCVLYIDKVSYSIERADNNFYLYINIPFGKKIPSEYLDLVNILNVSDEQKIDKFRLKKVDVDFTMSSSFIHKDGSMYRGDSYSHGKALIISRKKTLDIALKSLQEILSMDTESPAPITEEQTREKPTLEIIDNM